LTSSDNVLSSVVSEVVTYFGTGKLSMIAFTGAVAVGGITPFYHFERFGAEKVYAGVLVLVGAIALGTNSFVITF
jgi:hypothetical protein